MASTGSGDEQRGPPEELGDRLKGAGKRLTPQRRLVLDAVERLGHATPDEVLAEARRHKPELSLSTVYRNLEVLEELGLVRHAHLTDRAPTYHSVGGHEHFHLVCRGCGEVLSVGPSLLAPLLEQLDAEFGFVPDVGHLTVFGSCRSCR
ncbi:transcriptional repressor [Nocardioides sp.]|uniref:Fur family transcriptional regulator n=1 Tax=Nocardioides sp. TaxID=35761 RepID=UPI002C3AEB34|nr:transcriptional repressor [Nocardioides sp.]HSX67840.1 transcriptional repressor [Nocardioides sp.]